MLRKNTCFLMYNLFVFLLLSYNFNLFSLEFTGVPLGRNFIADESLNFYSDINEYQIVKYSSKGEELFRIGQKGEGPGDIKQLGWFTINPKDSLLYVTERANGNRRISVFSPENGHFVRIWPCKLDWLNWDSISNIHCDQMGNIYVQAEKIHWRPNKNFSLGAIERVIIKYGHDGTKIKEMYRMQADFMAMLKGKGNVTIPDSNYLSWKVAGKFLIVRENNKQDIDIFFLNGDLYKTIRLPFEKVKITEDYKDIWAKNRLEYPSIKQGIREGWFDLKFWRKNLPFPKYKSISGDQMFVDSRNNLYSRKSPEYDTLDENIWAIINLDSGKIGVYTLPFKHRVRLIKDHNFFLSTMNEDDEPVLKILDIQQVVKK